MADLSYPLGHKIKNTPESTLQKALELDVVLSATGGKLHAAGDRASVAELAPLLRQHRAELVGLLTMPTPTPPPPPHRPAPAQHRPAPGQHGADTVPAPDWAAPAKPMGRWHMNQPWRAADQLYERHHWLCPRCMAAARAAPSSGMQRCTEGQRLHDDCAAQAATA